MKKILIIILIMLASLPVFGQLASDTTLRANICFQINTAEIVPKDPGYEKYINEMLPFMYDNIYNLYKVVIRGSSSPDGPEELNRRLAKERADKIVSELHISQNKLFVTYASEDYDRLLTMVDESSKLDIINLRLGDNIKNAIRKLTGYRTMVDSIYPSLRSVLVEMYFIKNEPCISDTVYIVDIVRDTTYQVVHDTLYLHENYDKIPVLAFKTNLLADALITPNVQAEFYLYKHNLSIEMEYEFPWFYNDDIFWYYQVLDATAGVRMYLKDDYTGHWLGVYGNAYLYDICFNKNNGWQGEGWGLGVSYGYAIRSKKHEKLRFEPYIRVGYLRSTYDVYNASDPFNGKYYYSWPGLPNNFVRRNLEFNYFGPTMIGINISYDAIFKIKDKQ